METIRLLIADDDRFVRNLIAYQLGLRGVFEIETCRRGDEAVERMLRNGIDVVVMDIRMPKLNGIEAVTRIRAFSDVPIVVLSAFGDAKSRRAAIEAGANKFMVKPADYHKLTRVLVGLVTQKQQARPKRREMAILQRRLQLLREQQAAKGLDTPPAILIEIEDIEQKIEAMNDATITG